MGYEQQIKNRVIYVTLFLLFGFLGVNAQEIGRVGINNKEPNAVLDIQADTPDTVLRVSVLKDLEEESYKNESFILFLGEPKPNDDLTLYLRRLSLDKLIGNLKTTIPSFNKITVTNNAEAQFNRRDAEDQKVSLNKVLVNSNEDMFEYVPENNSIKLKKAGYYDVNAFVGFKSLPKQYEGDILISVAKKEADGSFTNFKRVIVTRSYGGTNYDVGTGVGSSINFIYEFEENDEIILNVMKYTGGKNLVLLEDGATLTVKRVSPSNVQLHK